MARSSGAQAGLMRRRGRGTLECSCSTCHGDDIVHVATGGVLALNRQATCVGYNDEEHAGAFTIGARSDPVRYWE